MVVRNSLSQTEKYLGFKRAHDTFKAYRERGDRLAAYVVAFSIFEDRLTACFLLAHDLAQQARPSCHTALYKKIGYLATAGLLSKERAEAWRRSGDERNRLLHDAMWTIDVITDSDCQSVLSAARETNRLSKQLKGSLQAQNR